MAIARAGAKESGKQLFQYLNDGNQTVLPIPMMNILNGGSHANNSVDIQEFMVMPFGASSFSEALQMGTEIFHYLKSVLNKKGWLLPLEMKVVLLQTLDLTKKQLR